LNEIFGQLGTIVTEHGTMLGPSQSFIDPSWRELISALFSDNIESNISSVEADTREADRELVTAADYQRKAGRRAACLMIVMIVVICIVLLAVRILIKIAPWLLPW
jgi:SNARE domain